MSHTDQTGSEDQHRCVFVSDDGTFRVVEITAAADEGTLTPLQHLVDGYIERVVGAVVPPDGGTPETVDIWVNEHGRFRRDFEPNLAIVALLSSPVLLVGPAVVTIINNEGDTCGLSEHLIDAARGAASPSVGAVELTRRRLRGGNRTGLTAGDGPPESSAAGRQPLFSR